MRGTVARSNLPRRNAIPRRLASDEPRYYYWEVIECIRRLALTGLLALIGSEIKAIIVASIISIASLQLCE